MKTELLERVERHGQKLLAIFPNAKEQDPVKLCKKLRRIETKAERLALDWANGDIQTEDWEREEPKIMQKLTDLLQPGTVPLYINSDPRGYALKIPDAYVREHQLDIHRDWGGYGIIAPDLTEA